MQFLNRPRLFALSFALTIALIAGGFAYASQAAAPPSIYLLGQKTQPCPTGGPPVSTGVQSMPFGIGLRYFYAEEPVYLSLTFPDGRVISPIAASFNAPDTENGLDGKIDMPPNPAYSVITNAGGDYYALLDTNEKWPLGCYTVSALGVQSGNQASATYQVVSDDSVALAPGDTRLEVQSKSDKTASGLQGSTVEIFGRGFLAEENIALSLIQPNGTELALEDATTSLIGSFQTSFDLDESYSVGEYRVIAEGSESSIAGTFTLSATTTTTGGFGRLRVARPAGTTITVAQGESFEIQGQQFFAGEPLVINALRPDGSMRMLAVAGANELGEFATELTLSNLMPTGAYTLIVSGELSGYRTTLKLKLEAGSPNITDETLVPAAPADAPAPPIAPTNPPASDGGGTDGGDFGKGVDSVVPATDPAMTGDAAGSATNSARFYASGSADVVELPSAPAPTAGPPLDIQAAPPPSF